MTDGPIAGLDAVDRHAIAAWIGERPETVLATHALTSGTGRLWLDGAPGAPQAVLVESALTPGEPQGFGSAEGLRDLLERADGWRCIEVDDRTAAELRETFARRWGIEREVTDVIHVLDGEPPDRTHPLVRRIDADEITGLAVADPDLLPARLLVEAAAATGRLHAAIDGLELVGHGSSFAAGDHYADVGVAVLAPYRRQGIATAAAARTCRALVAAGLEPVWGAGAHNDASLATAAALGFREVSRLTYLVRAR